MKLSLKIILVVTIVLAGFLIFYFLIQTQPKKYITSLEKIKVGLYKSEFSSLIFIAEARGYFKDNGLDVNISEFDSGSFPTSEMLKGTFDFSVAAEFVAVRRIFDNKNLRILSTIDLPLAIEVIAKKSSGILTPQDLRDKKIGLQKKSQAEFLLGEFLLFHNMKYSDVKIVGYEQVRDFKDHFLKGDLDAVVVWDPFTYHFKKELGENAVSWSAQQNHPFYFLAFTRTDVIDTKPHIVRKFVQALVEAEEYLKKNNEEARIIVRDRLAYEDSYLREVWSKNELSMKLSQDLILTMEDEARWAIKNGITPTTRVPNYLDFIYFDALEAVKPDAVTIIH